VRFLACLLLVLGLSAGSTTTQAASFDDLDAAIVADRLDEARRVWEELGEQEGSQDIPAQRHRDYGRLIDVLERGQNVLTVAERTNDANALNKVYQGFADSWQGLGGSLAISATVLDHANAIIKQVSNSYQSAFTEIAEGRRTNSGGGTGEQGQADAPGLDFSALEDLLIAGKLQEAGALWEEMGRGRGSPDFPYAEYNSYRDVFEILEGAQAVLKTAADPAGADRAVLDIHYGKYTRDWQEKAPKLGVSARLAGHLNETRDRVNEGYERALAAESAAAEAKEAEGKAKVETQAESIRELERLLMANRLGEARRIWEDLKRQGFEGRYWGKRNRFDEIFPALEKAQEFRSAAEAYEGTEEQWSAVEAEKSWFDDRWDRIVKDLPFDQEFIDHLNKTLRDVGDQYNSVKARHEAEQARIAKAEIDKLDALSDAAVVQGYKGLNKEVGPARFLIDAMRGASLEDGLNQVFRTQRSNWEGGADDLFRLSQVVDGWQIYDFSRWTGEEWLRFSIAVPDDGGFTMEDQHLKEGFYVYEGPVEFTTVTGVSRRIQVFKPVELNVE
jgi:hypothetical protein